MLKKKEEARLTEPAEGAGHLPPIRKWAHDAPQATACSLMLSLRNTDGADYFVVIGTTA